MKYIKLLIVLLLVISCSNDGDTTISNGDGTGGSLAIFALKGNYLYTVDQNNLNIFAISDTAQPTFVNSVNVGFDIETLFSFDAHLYIGSRNGMFIYDVVNPENPALLSSVQHFRSCDPVVANATHSFVTLHSNTDCGSGINVLQVYDTADLSNPLLIHQRTLFSPKGLGLYHNYLILCDDEIKIFDIVNPAEPVLVKAIPKNCFDVIIKDNDLYAIGESGLYRYTLDNDNITNVVLQSEITF